MTLKILKNKKFLTFAGIYLVQTKQIFKPKATTDLYNAFSVSSNEPGKEVTCSGSTCQTNTLNINIKLEDLDTLTQ